jgi:acetylornithine deacetylase/succinyl-diaminopimelate desuccinylase-like protein
LEEKLREENRAHEENIKELEDGSAILTIDMSKKAVEIFAKVAVKIPGIERISAMTSGGTSLSTFSTMIASSPGLIRRPACRQC